ncbi:hypothetical protein [Methylomonas koyamae]|uniref:hypothetical protein n=1 Tax=Methylomonas koyamae TaxID=702114 RepID=UPI000AAE3564|nr:hypothetical protein [Methylomonas koyamae]
MSFQAYLDNIKAKTGMGLMTSNNLPQKRASWPTASSAPMSKQGKLWLGSRRTLNLGMVMQWPLLPFSKVQKMKETSKGFTRSPALKTSTSTTASGESQMTETLSPAQRVCRLDKFIVPNIAREEFRTGSPPFRPTNRFWYYSVACTH